ncbi:DUF1573 domain-containing protein [Sphingomonas sp.]|uniref:DUF1573 domain-containing protein n=1 Tax=Sphingomonas sp. TaxID=28214 RepID=UPI001EC489AE|nr:DUF1573 domain-containing protein [Sphingomonas sp.]MBX3595441.1 DUF1573 domain-containing protein [Sphingomonas sp.]
MNGRVANRVVAAVAAASLAAFPAFSAAQNPKAPRFLFSGETFDFGTIPEGPVAEHIFMFKNVGKEPLIIQSASASCGCVTPDWPKEPILPGKSGKIIVHYSTQGRVGPFSKTVYIASNVASERDRYELYIKGTVQSASAASRPFG